MNLIKSLREQSSSKGHSLFISFTCSLLGSVVLGIFAQASVPLPFTPIPLSLQTLGVSLLAICLGSRGALLAVALYLLQATIGLPVLAGGIVNPFWIAKPSAGYLIGFLVSAYITGYLLEKLQPRSLLKTGCVLLCNEVIILNMGTLWLGFIVGFENAFYLGLLPFVPGALIKCSLATISERCLRWTQL